MLGAAENEPFRDHPRGRRLFEARSPRTSNRALTAIVCFGIGLVVLIARRVAMVDNMSHRQVRDHNSQAHTQSSLHLDLHLYRGWIVTFECVSVLPGRSRPESWGGDGDRYRRKFRVVHFEPQPHSACVYDVVLQWCDALCLARRGEWSSYLLLCAPHPIRQSQTTHSVTGYLSLQRAFRQDSQRSSRVRTCDRLFLHRRSSHGRCR
jgi:hypothetical protein